MAGNDYGNNPSNNLLLAMFDEDFNDYNGLVPAKSNDCKIVSDQCPPQANQSLYTGSQSFVKYDIKPVGISDFTLDFWILYKSGYSGITTATTYSEYGVIANDDNIWLGNGNSPSNQFIIIDRSAFKKDVWAHYAVIREGYNLYYFIDGILQKNVTTTQILNLTSTQLLINGEYVNAWFGGAAYYKAVRLCNFARWTADFAVPKPRMNTVNYLYLKDNAVYGIKAVE